MATFYMAPTSSPPAGWSAGNDGNDGLAKSTPKATLVAAFAAMKAAGGQTELVIADGTYTGADNCVGMVSGAHGNATDGSHNPPSGTAEAYTVIRAENEGGVTFSPNVETYAPFHVDSDYNTADCAYVEWHGLKWIDGKVNPSWGGISLDSAGWHHHKFFRIGIHRKSRAGDVACNVEKSQYILFEECYIWGTTRYGFIATGRSGEVHYVIYRRCLVRMEDVTGSYPNGESVAAFQAYSARAVEYQNCIVIDTDMSTWTYRVGTAGFACRPGYGGGYDLRYRGNIVLKYLNTSNYFGVALAVNNPDASATNVYENFVLWDVGLGVQQYTSVTSVGSPVVNGLTLFAGTDPNWGGTRLNKWLELPGSEGFFGTGNAEGPWVYSLKNYVIVAHQELALISVNSDYGLVYSNSGGFSTSHWGYQGPGANDYAENITTGVYPSGRASHPTNNEFDPFTGLPTAGSSLGNGIPALKYICRIEPGSNLSGTGDGGADRGATVVKRYGVSGTLWGETGYNTLTDEDLWPFPYEAQIRADMRTYAISGNPYGVPDDPDFGKRGFCADGETLTHYIWNYLGNGNPYAQVAVPDADVSAGTWTASTGSDLYTMVAEFPPDDTTYIRSSATPTDDTAVLGVTMQPPADGPVILHIRGRWI